MRWACHVTLKVNIVVTIMINDVTMTTNNLTHPLLTKLTVTPQGESIIK